MRSGSCRSGPCHDAAVLYAGRRRCHVTMRVRRAKIAGVRRRSIDATGDARVAQRTSREVRGVAIDRLAIHKGVVRSGGDRVCVAGVPVIEIPEVVHVVKIVKVVEVRVVHVHVIPVTRTTVIPRTERLSPTKGEPAIAAAPAESETNPNPKSAAKESDKRGTIIRRSINRTRAPTPIGTEIVPAPVVIRRETPRLSANPGPAPGRDIGPVAVAIGSPTRRDVVGNPDVADFRLFFPGSVVVEIAIAHCVARNVAR